MLGIQVRRGLLECLFDINLSKSAPCKIWKHCVADTKSFNEASAFPLHWNFWFCKQDFVCNCLLPNKATLLDTEIGA